MNMNTSYNEGNLNAINLNINAKEYDNSYKKIKPLINQPNKQNVSTNKTKIIEVYEDNFIAEIKNISKYLINYPFVGMDTEFPGVLYPCKSFTTDFYYKFTKENVDKLKLIQIGISLFNKKGEKPPFPSTWQFNLKFDLKKDEIAQDALNLLKSSGLDFDKLKNKGIKHELFAEYFISSGLILNEHVIWISFNGFSDFAYLINLASNQKMPESENEFSENLELYFPNVYDIKKMLANIDLFKGGLNKVAKELKVERFGEMHQAGSDSMVTGEVFFSLLKMNYISLEDLNTEKNILFGIGAGLDNAETITYTQFISEPTPDLVLSMLNGSNNYSSFYQNNFPGPMGNAYDALINQVNFY